MICENANFGKVIEMLNIGEVAKLPEWHVGYIFKKDSALWIKSEDGREYRHDDIEWLHSIIWRTDWQICYRHKLRED